MRPDPGPRQTRLAQHHHFDSVGEAISNEKPIDLIRATRPIVIVDGPQRAGGPRTRGKPHWSA